MLRALRIRRPRPGHNREAGIDRNRPTRQPRIALQRIVVDRFAPPNVRITRPVTVLPSNGVHFCLWHMSSPRATQSLGIENHDIGVGPDRDRAFARVEIENLRRVGRDLADELVSVHAALVDRVIERRPATASGCRSDAVGAREDVFLAWRLSFGGEPAMIGADHVDRLVQHVGPDASTSVLIAQRRRAAAEPLQRTRSSVLSARYCGQVSTVTLTPRARASRDQAQGVGGGAVADMHPAAGDFGRDRARSLTATASTIGGRDSACASGSVRPALLDALQAGLEHDVVLGVQSVRQPGLGDDSHRRSRSLIVVDGGKRWAGRGHKRFEARPRRSSARSCDLVRILAAVRRRCRPRAPYRRSTLLLIRSRLARNCSAVTVVGSAWGISITVVIPPAAAPSPAGGEAFLGEFFRFAEMGVDIDPAGHHQQSGRIDPVVGLDIGRVAGQRGDALIRNDDISAELSIVRDDGTALNHDGFTHA